MKLSSHFDLTEFTDSDTALRLTINNDLPIALLEEAKRTADMMERIRAFLSDLHAQPVPISISSGYRCLALNRAIGSADSSDHIRMLAIDFRAPSFGTPLSICKALAPVADVLHLGQLIYEHTWVHCSSRTPDKFINRIITVQGKGYVPGIVEA